MNQVQRLAQTWARYWVKTDDGRWVATGELLQPVTQFLLQNPQHRSDLVYESLSDIAAGIKKEQAPETTESLREWSIKNPEIVCRIALSKNFDVRPTEFEDLIKAYWQHEYEETYEAVLSLIRSHIGKFHAEKGKKA